MGHGWRRTQAKSKGFGLREISEDMLRSEKVTAHWRSVELTQPHGIKSDLVKIARYSKQPMICWYFGSSSAVPPSLQPTLKPLNMPKRRRQQLLVCIFSFPFLFYYTNVYFRYISTYGLPPTCQNGDGSNSSNLHRMEVRRMHQQGSRRDTAQAAGVFFIFYLLH